MADLSQKTIDNTLGGNIGCCEGEGSSSSSLSTSSSSSFFYKSDKSSSASSISVDSETTMKERLSKLLLGEDMSGCGNGVCTALAISNSITNLCATLFGQLWRLEPVPLQKKSMWRREMEWLLCVSDHIVELISSSETFSDGNKLEVMTCRPRSDVYINLPALRKLDNMLLEILDSFEKTEFWYVDQGILGMESDGSSSFRNTLQREEDKWWLPIPQVPHGGLSDDSRKSLRNKRDCVNQIFKAATAINKITIADMEFPESYLESLPKNARGCLGDIIYRYITSDQFYPDCLLDCLDLSSEHQAIEISNRVEASIFIWSKRGNPNPRSKSSSKSSWGLVKDLVVNVDKREVLADRAESLLHCLKQRFPGLPQTNLDMSKIQFNKDVGRAILESYSRVLECLAFNIVARIDDVLYVDDLSQNSDELSLNPNSSSEVAQECNPATCASTNPYKTAFATPSFSPAHIFTSAEGERSPFGVTCGKTPLGARGSSIRKVLNSYLSDDDSRAVLESTNNIKVVDDSVGQK